MKFIIFFFLPFVCFSQTAVNLRDVGFKVPSEFSSVVKENLKMNYDVYYENGKIYVDSINENSLPKIAYQYYENPSAGNELSAIVLKDLNDIMVKDFKQDTLIINGLKNYSLAKYKVMGNSLFEIKSLGQKGWLNIQLIDQIENDKSNFQKMLFIVGSIKHLGPYGIKKQKLMSDSERASKWAILCFIIYLLLYFVRKYNNKIVRWK